MHQLHVHAPEHARLVAAVLQLHAWVGIISPCRPVRLPVARRPLVLRVQRVAVFQVLYVKQRQPEACSVGVVWLLAGQKCVRLTSVRLIASCSCTRGKTCGGLSMAHCYAHISRCTDSSCTHVSRLLRETPSELCAHLWHVVQGQLIAQQFPPHALNVRLQRLKRRVHEACTLLRR